MGHHVFGFFSFLVLASKAGCAPFISLRCAGAQQGIFIECIQKLANFRGLIVVLMETDSIWRWITTRVLWKQKFLAFPLVRSYFVKIVFYWGLAY